jgi:hypothetical protein
VGPFAVVDPQPGIGQGAQFRDRFEEVLVTENATSTKYSVPWKRLLNTPPRVAI